MPAARPKGEAEVIPAMRLDQGWADVWRDLMDADLGNADLGNEDLGDDGRSGWRVKEI